MFSLWIDYWWILFLNSKADETGYITSSTASDVEDQSECGVTIIMERLDVKPNNLNNSFNNSNSSNSENNSSQSSFEWCS